MSRQNISVLGATGSIGRNTLDVIRRHPERYAVYAMSGYSRMETLVEECLIHKPRYAVTGTEAGAQFVRARLAAAGQSATEVLAGDAALEAIACAEEVDTVMAAIVGAAGLRSTLAAVRAGKRILLANKEALVMAGELFMAEVRNSGSIMLPIDSEHNAIFQSLPPGKDNLKAEGVRRLVLTASGGPFRNCSKAQLEQVTPEQACAHPNWVMGRKISVDSATMMNKGLEVIEARWLFGVSPECIEVVVHPQSMIHSMVQYVDGSMLAQLGNPDMRTPIAHALAYPERIDAGVAPLDLCDIGRLDFQRPDRQMFPCLDLAYHALRVGGNAATLLNAANEIAVEAFLAGRLPFHRIADVIAASMEAIPVAAMDDLDAVMMNNELGRREAAAIARRWE